MLALDVRHGFAIALSAGVTVALLAGGSPCRHGAVAASMPAPDPEVLEPSVRATAQVGCEDLSLQTVVFRGQVHAADPDLYATYNFRFAELPDRYTVMTGPHGEFEVRVSRTELAVGDLCSLPLTAQFADAQLSITYHLSFER